MKDGVELSRDGKYRIKKEGKKHWLIINEATKEDIGMYQVYTSGGESKGELEVEGIPKIVCLINNRNVTVSLTVLAPKNKTASSSFLTQHIPAMFNIT